MEGTPMREVISLIQSINSYMILGLSALSLILLICVLVISRKLAKLSARKNAKLEEGGVVEILNCLQEQMAAVAAIQNQLNTITAKQAEQDQRLAHCLQRTGMIRFNAFNDIGGEQSVAVAILDGQKNGIVISSLYGRQSSLVYAKGIISGEGERTLSDEERKALAKALS